MPHPLVVNRHDDPDYDYYIGRGTIWGNDFVMQKGDNRGDIIHAYDDWIHHPAQAELRAQLYKLRGRRLGCSCAPSACHGDVLARMANNPFVLKAFCGSNWNVILPKPEYIRGAGRA